MKPIPMSGAAVALTRARRTGLERATHLVHTVALSVAIVAIVTVGPACGQERSGVVATADGARIHYVDAGAGTPIVFIPGWTMPADIWRPQLDHFSRTHRTIAIDPRCQGTSSCPPEGLDSATRARDIRAVVAHLELKSVVLVAWSQAVTEAAAYVDQFGTADVAGLVFVDGVAGGEFDAATIGRIVSSLAAFQSDRAAATDAFVRRMYFRSQPEPYIEAIKRASVSTPTSAAIAMSVGALTADYQRVLPTIDKPCLIVAPAAGMLDLYRSMRDKLPNARLVTIDRAGHAVFVDAPDEFNRLLAEFVANAVSGRSER
jgi:non-heme chloroperoxidase